MDPGTTCWTLIKGAAEGDADDRAQFARCYEPVVRAYLQARWRNSPLTAETDDATQEVFVECFRPDGALGRVGPGEGKKGFRAYLHAVVRNVARRAEDRRARRREQPVASGFEVADDDPSLATAFDQAWTLSLLDQAVELQEVEARTSGPHAIRRVELLKLRFQEGVTMREMARRWEMPESRLHYHYTRALDEFRAALRKIVAFHNPDNIGAGDGELGRLRELIHELDI